ncbi:MAG TPA: polysaccharide biosynthesis tyrosine autokinase [Kiritimatiellia bacterium]|nr:polysaccharide biosynthesis tyrosine autokinase [Kiritimatiellia bacterium]
MNAPRPVSRPPAAPDPAALAPSAPSPYYAESQMDGGPLHALDPLRLLRIARKKWLTILLTAAFILGAAAFYLRQAPKIYQAWATIELSVRRPRILNKQDAMIEDPTLAVQVEETLNTQIEKFKSSSMRPHVLASYRKLYPDDRMSEAELGQRLSGRANFSLVRHTRLVRVAYASRDPEFAIRACNAFAAGAEASTRAENREVSDAAVAWLEAQAEGQKRELDSADQALLDARQQYQLDVLEGQRKTMQGTLLSFNEALTQVENKATLERKLLDALSAVELEPEKAGDLPVDIPRAADVAGALERWRVAVSERDRLMSRYTAKHPAVQAQDQAVELYREQAMSALQRAKSTAAANLALYDEQADSLRRKKEDQLKLASDLDRDILDATMKIAALERARSAADASFMGVLYRIQEARLSADENTATVKLVEHAQRAIQIHPRPLRVLFMALLLGAGLGLGLAFLSDLLEDHVVDVQDIEGGTGIKILAIIPHVRTRDRKEIALASWTHSHGEMAEAFAGLRSVLDSAAYRDQARVILAASSLPEEGKTSTCCNLATACARTGQRTLLIDFDLRRPRIGGIFPMPRGHQGLLEYLASRNTRPGDITYASGCPNLDVIASRVSGEARPSELVGGAKVADLLAWARTSYDRVVIDAPPLGIVSDALSLAGQVDCVLVMARPGISRKRAVRHTIRRFRDVGISAIAVVMNDVDHSKFAYHGYGPYYHYQKHYHSYAEPPPSPPPAGDGGTEAPAGPEPKEDLT